MRFLLLPQVNKMTTRFALLFVVLITFSCSDNDYKLEKSFVGNWIVVEAKKDSFIKPEWIGTYFTVQNDWTDGGVYLMPNTRYDSIWGKKGKWAKTNQEYQLILDDTLLVNYFYTEETDELTIIKNLPWTAEQCVVNEPCPTVVTGFWQFTFARYN